MGVLISKPDEPIKVIQPKIEFDVKPLKALRHELMKSLGFSENKDNK
jgi:hypothetical protein